MNQEQLSIRMQEIQVRPEEIQRKDSLGKSIELCAELAGFSLDKELQMSLGVDKGQFSRWLNGTEGIVWPKLNSLMDVCANDAPVLWMMHQRGYDLNSFRRRESETEQQLRLMSERAAEIERENKLLRSIIAGRA